MQPLFFLQWNPHAGEAVSGSLCLVSYLGPLTYTYTRIYTHTHTHTYTRTHTRAHTHTPYDRRACPSRTQTDTHARTHTSTHTHAHTHTHTHAHTYTHARTHTYKHPADAIRKSGFDRTGWRRLIGSPNLQIIFLKRATKYRSLLQ